MKLYKVFQQNVFDTEKTFVEYTDDFNVKNYIKRDHEMYESIYLYTDAHLEYYKTHFNDKGHNSLAGITDNYTDKIVFDFDSKNDKKLALVDARTIVSRLLTFIDPHAIRCFFSGNKGYHVEVHFNEYINREALEAILKEYTAGLKTFDVKIKDQQRLFRFPLSQNKESKMYKLPFLTDDFLDHRYAHDDFQASGKTPEWDYVNTVIGQFSTIDIPLQFQAAIEKSSKPEVKVSGEEDVGPDMTLRPRFLNPAKYVLSLGYFDESERHEACMILAATYKYLNFTKNQAYGMIKIALKNRAERLGLKYNEDSKKELWNKELASVYSQNWSGATYSDTTNPLLIKTIEQYDLSQHYNSNSSKNVVTMAEVANNFLNFAKNIDNNIIKTGIAEFDKDIILTSSMMVGVLGAPSSGKTSLALSIVENQAKSGINSFFYSADMGDKLFYARVMQKYCGYSFQRIVDEMKIKGPHEWPKELKDAFEQANENFKNVGLGFNSGPTHENIRDAVDQHEQDTGKAVKALFVDYLEKMRCEYSDANAASAHNASRLADFTRDKDLTTFLMLQTQKHGGDPSDELTSMRRVKGSSVIEQDCRVIMSTWRPGFNPDVKGPNQDDKFACIAVVKNNMGTTGRYDLRFDGAKGLYTSLNDEDIPVLDDVKQRAAMRKAAKANGTYVAPSQAKKPFVPNSKGGILAGVGPSLSGETEKPRKNVF